MFFVLLNEDQTPGFLAKALPPPSSAWSRGAAEIEGPVLPQERRIFFSPLLFPLIHFSPTSPSSPSRSFSNQPLWHPEFISSLRRPWPRWIGPSEVFSSASWGKLEVRLGRLMWHSTGSLPKGVRLSCNWTRTLKRVYTQTCDKAKGQGRCQMKSGPD